MHFKKTYIMFKETSLYHWSRCGMRPNARHVYNNAETGFNPKLSNPQKKTCFIILIFDQTLGLIKINFNR